MPLPPVRASGLLRAPLKIIVAAIALAGLLVPLLVVAFGPHVVSPPHAGRRRLPLPVVRRVVPPAELPPVEPVKLAELTPDDARAYNADVPFSTAAVPAARPFVLHDGPDDLARATDCLAAAVWYEAGDDAVGERAVAQVVLNRVRHPAFPKTVCGVVFQGSDRTTGCQFTFACDGSLVRVPSAAAWTRARDVANKALAGAVDKTVGYATHYHTDWVVPYWQSSLDKIAAVHTHLFFRWSGWWGTPGAFNRQVQSSEPVVMKLAALSDAHRLGAALLDGDDALAAFAAAAGPPPQPLASSHDSFLVTLDPRHADGFPALAARTCGDRPYCKFLGWTARAQTPAALPLSARQVDAMAFSYLRDRASGYDKPLWNCARFKRADPNECMKTQALLPADAMPDPQPTATPAIAALAGVRRKGDPAATLAPAPTPRPTATPAPLRPPGTSPAATP